MAKSFSVAAALVMLVGVGTLVLFAHSRGWFDSPPPLVQAPAGARPAAERERVDNIERQFARLQEERRLDEAIQLVTDYVKAHPDEQRWRLELGMMLTVQGEVDRAIQTWKEGLRNKPADAELHRAIAYFYDQQAEDGPNLKRTASFVTASPARQSKAEIENWTAKRLEFAVEHWRLAQKLEAQESTAEQLCEALSKLDLAKHFQEVEDLTAEYPASLVITGVYARGLLKASRNDDAWARVQQIIERQPREAATWRLAAEVQTALKRPEDAALSERKATFFEVVPAFLELDWTAETESTVKMLSAGERLGDSVKQWQAEDSELTSQLLALVCHLHVAHGSIEDSCFAELQKRKAGDLVVGLVHNANSTCTLRGGGKILASLKHPEALEILSQMMESGDHAFFPHEAELALAELGDVRAVPVLIAALGPHAPKTAPSRDDPFSSMGVTARRLRCAVALSSFRDPAAEAALLLGTKNPVLDTVCHAALFRLAEKPAHLSALQKTFGKERMKDAHAASILRLCDTPEAKTLVADWEKEIQAERAREEKTQETK